MSVATRSATMARPSPEARSISCRVLAWPDLTNVSTSARLARSAARARERCLPFGALAQTANLTLLHVNDVYEIAPKKGAGGFGQQTEFLRITLGIAHKMADAALALVRDIPCQLPGSFAVEKHVAKAS